MIGTMRVLMDVMGKPIWIQMEVNDFLMPRIFMTVYHLIGPTTKRLIMLMSTRITRLLCTGRGVWCIRIPRVVLKVSLTWKLKHGT